jgi:hypothetical protein
MNGFARVGTGVSPVQAERSSAGARQCPRSAAAVIIIVFSWRCLAGAQTAPAWRYDLHPGDHLTYRFTFQRRTQSNEEQSQVEARFRTHMLVAGEDADRISLGFNAIVKLPT